MFPKTISHISSNGYYGFKCINNNINKIELPESLSQTKKRLHAEEKITSNRKKFRFQNCEEQFNVNFGDTPNSNMDVEEVDFNIETSSKNAKSLDMKKKSYVSLNSNLPSWSKTKSYIFEHTKCKGYLEARCPVEGSAATNKTDEDYTTSNKSKIEFDINEIFLEQMFSEIHGSGGHYFKNLYSDNL